MKRILGHSARTVGIAVLAAPLALLGLPPAAGVGAAAPTCQGQEATIVGAYQKGLEGTGGADVIVSNGASYVNARGGDDLVCITGRSPDRDGSRARAGAGDDRVYVLSSSLKGSSVELGAGEDTFVGGPGPDRVAGQRFDNGTPTVDADPDADLITTRGGNDVVDSGRIAVMNDRVGLGSGNDLVRVHGATSMAPTARLVGGAGRDELEFAVPDSAGELLVDNVAESATVDGAAAWSWGDMETFDLTGSGGATLVDFVGGFADETLWLDTGVLRKARMGMGADRLELGVLGTGHAAPDVRGGPGRDTLFVFTRWPRLELNLAQDRVAIPARDVVVDIPGFEDARAAATRRLVMVGDGGANRLTGDSCNTTIAGRKGADRLAFADYWSGQGSGFDCGRSSVRRTELRGQEGNDRLRGSYDPDRLVGGPGFDRGDGGKSRDLCIGVERRISCERVR